MDDNERDKRIILSQLEIYVDSIKSQTNKLRKAVQDGIYDARSIVGDSVLRMEDYTKRIEEKIEIYHSGDKA